VFQFSPDLVRGRHLREESTYCGFELDDEHDRIAPKPGRETRADAAGPVLQGGAVAPGALETRVVHCIQIAKLARGNLQLHVALPRPQDGFRQPGFFVSERAGR
jgi:hypothetical protein